MLRVGIPERIKGYKAVEIVGSNFDLFYTSEDREAGAQKRRSGLQLETGASTQGRGVCARTGQNLGQCSYPSDSK
jgi:hypothetical protein